MAKVMVSLPDDLLRMLDDEAQRRGTTRSGLLRDYIDEGMKARARARARRVKAILSEVQDLGPEHGGSSLEYLKQERQLRLDKLGRHSQ